MMREIRHNIYTSNTARMCTAIRICGVLDCHPLFPQEAPDIHTSLESKQCIINMADTTLERTIAMQGAEESPAFHHGEITA
eukprot:365914-Chlamydomonas_euryale.AAC.2